jgi:hypothetical protein
MRCRDTSNVNSIKQALATAGFTVVAAGDVGDMLKVGIVALAIDHPRLCSASCRCLVTDASLVHCRRCRRYTRTPCTPIARRVRVR